jgi:dihydroorotate dehydrogenase
VSASADRVVDGGYRRLARPVLFRVGGGDAEAAHGRTLAVLAALSRRGWSSAATRRLLAADSSPRRVFGIDFGSPVGVAAGLDKDGMAAASWAGLGFGFAELGTVTAIPQPGNPRPRVFRLPASRAVINRMGFPNAGAAALARRLTALGELGLPVGISLGKSAITPIDRAIPDYLTSLRAVRAHADYIAVNVSSPNTAGLRGLQDRAPLDELLAALVAETVAPAGRDRPAGGDRRPVPVLVKIAPDLSDHAIGDVIEVCEDRGVAGLIAVNTTVVRDGLAAADAASGAERGGLSGAPLHRRALEVVRFVTGRSRLPVIGVGGISTPDDGLAMLDAGASLIQLYTGLIYAGPGLVRDLNRAIASRPTAGPPTSRTPRTPPRTAAAPSGAAAGSGSRRSASSGRLEP